MLPAPPAVIWCALPPPKRKTKIKENTEAPIKNDTFQKPQPALPGGQMTATRQWQTRQARQEVGNAHKARDQTVSFVSVALPCSFASPTTAVYSLHLKLVGDGRSVVSVHQLLRVTSHAVFCDRTSLITRRGEQGGSHTPSTAFRHLLPNSARFSYATEGALFISAQLCTDAVSALRKVPVLIWLWKQPSAQAPA